MKRLLIVLLIVHSGLSEVFAGKPCLQKDNTRTKERLCLELKLPANALLKSEYYKNVNNLLTNKGKKSLVNDQDLCNVILASKLMNKAECNAVGIYYMDNGYIASNGSLFYSENELLKENYLYLVYEGEIICSISCGNPNRIELLYVPPPVTPPPVVPPPVVIHDTTVIIEKHYVEVETREDDYYEPVRYKRRPTCRPPAPRCAPAPQYRPRPLPPPRRKAICRRPPPPPPQRIVYREPVRQQPKIVARPKQGRPVGGRPTVSSGKPVGGRPIAGTSGGRPVGGRPRR